MTPSFETSKQGISDQMIEYAVMDDAKPATLIMTVYRFDQSLRAQT